MDSRPTLETERLVLRPFRLSDAPEVQRLAGDRRVAEMTMSIPHPYQDGVAEEWIGSHLETFGSGKEVILAVTLKAGGILLGAIGLAVRREHERAELGYWIGVPYWNQGYCTEAAAAVVRFGFESLGLHRIQANHYARNPASGRVMQRIGMTREGCLRRHIRRWDRSEDLVLYGILRDEVIKGVRLPADSTC